MTKMDCFVYIGKKVIVLFAIGGILGSLIGTAGQNFILLDFFKSNRNSISFKHNK